MKNAIEDRIKRIEGVLQSETVTCMIAMKTEEGISWNGVTYPDEEALDKALKEIFGEYQKGPVVIMQNRASGLK